MPRPDTTEKELIRLSAGEMVPTEGEKRARSSAKAKVLTEGRRERKWRRGS
jgi:hypothetical protein